jgi:hypothetical protein
VKKQSGKEDKDVKKQSGEEAERQRGKERKAAKTERARQRGRVKKKRGKEDKGMKQKKTGKKGKGMEKQSGKGVKRKRDREGVKMAVKLEFSGEVDQAHKSTLEAHVNWTLCVLVVTRPLVFKPTKHTTQWVALRLEESPSDFEQKVRVVLEQDFLIAGEVKMKKEKYIRGQHGKIYLWMCWQAEIWSSCGDRTDGRTRDPWE